MRRRHCATSCGLLLLLLSVGCATAPAAETPPQRAFRLYGEPLDIAKQAAEGIMVAAFKAKATGAITEQQMATVLKAERYFRATHSAAVAAYRAHVQLLAMGVPASETELAALAAAVPAAMLELIKAKGGEA